MRIDAIVNGIVIDHIRVGRSMEIYRALHLHKLDCPVAIITNVASKKMGRKDVIKVDTDKPLDLRVIGFVDPDVTIDVIKDGRVVEKKHLELPFEVRDLIRCKNPRCITSVEPDLPHVFRLDGAGNRIYRCIYCEADADSAGHN